MKTSTCSFLAPLLFADLLWSADAFLVPSASTKATGRISSWRLSATHANHDPYAVPTECFLVIDDDDNEQNDTDTQPTVVCTNTPADYAWFHGLDEDALVPLDSHHDADHSSAVATASLLECTETEDHRGFPSWECLGSQRLRP